MIQLDRCVACRINPRSATYPDVNIGFYPDVMHWPRLIALWSREK